MPPGVIVEGILGPRRPVGDQNFSAIRLQGEGHCHLPLGNSVIIKKVTLAQMEETELRELIHDEAGKYLPFDNMDDVNYDFQILGDNEFNPNQMDVIIVAAKKTDVNGYLDAFAAAGLTVMIMDVDSFALETMYEANYDFEENEIIVIVNIGASLTNINVIKGGMSVFTRDFTMAGNAITEALQERFQVTAEEAERMKVEGTAGDKEIPDLENVILDAAEPICSEIERSVDYFRSTFGGDEIKQVLLSGGSSRIAGLSDLLSQRLNIGTQLVNPLAKIGYNKKNIDEGKLDSIRTIGAVAIGLGLRKIGDK